MEAFKERLLKEYDELNDKLMKLSDFMRHDNEIYLSLSNHQQDLLINQYSFMHGYLLCLWRRIDLLVSKEELEEYRELNK